MTQALDVALLDDSDSTWVIGMSGEWDMYTGGLVVTELFEQAAARALNVILDVSKLTFVDSTGLSQILQLARATAEKERSLVLLQPTPSVAALLAATGLQGHLRTAGSEEEARAMLSER